MTNSEGTVFQKHSIKQEIEDEEKSEEHETSKAEEQHIVNIYIKPEVPDVLTDAEKEQLRREQLELRKKRRCQYMKDWREKRKQVLAGLLDLSEEACKMGLSGFLSSKSEQTAKDRLQGDNPQTNQSSSYTTIDINVGPTETPEERRKRKNREHNARYRARLAEESKRIEEARKKNKELEKIETPQEWRRRRNRESNAKYRAKVIEERIRRLLLGDQPKPDSDPDAPPPETPEERRRRLGKAKMQRWRARKKEQALAKKMLEEQRMQEMEDAGLVETRKELTEKKRRVKRERMAKWRAKQKEMRRKSSMTEILVDSDGLLEAQSLRLQQAMEWRPFDSPALQLAAYKAVVQQDYRYGISKGLGASPYDAKQLK